ncbi:MAG: glutamate synthase subunit beta [Spirochaetaceae bacterium]|jgi:glutamate synthase (NADPH/NADH) small chain|nr:glutamate synthase subunit beta [Spirochaetaceae bacterium]
MGDPKGFLNIKRKVSGYRPVAERINDYSEVEEKLDDDERRLQASRCMDCAVPFCHWACPLGNVMPEYQDRLYRGDYSGAWAILQETNPFPEFTGRVCPALCEASCVLGANDDPVTIRQNELAAIEKAFELGLVVPRPPKKRNGKRVAVIGGGPAGLSCAYFLNLFGFNVVVYEADRNVGGYLRYGIPNFKLNKDFIDRRVHIMEAEGVVFKTNTRVGNALFAFGTSGEGTEIVDAKKLQSEYDLVLISIGARQPRDIQVPGRELSGIVQALNFLSLQNRTLAAEKDGFGPINAFNKKVLVIGGGDTGSDCVGTANRQGAACVTQIEVMPKPPEHRPASQPWPLWPTLHKTSSSHLEGCDRLWSVNTKEFTGKDGAVKSVKVCKVEWDSSSARPAMKEVDGSVFEIEADLVLLAMGFTHVVQDGIVKDLGLETDERGNIRTQGSFHTSNPKVWAAGDARNGASLVVRALADGKAAAQAIAKTL